MLPEMVTNLSNVIGRSRRAMLVGDAVRDELMRVEPKDWDLEVYGIESGAPEICLNRFAGSLDREMDGRMPAVPLNVVGGGFYCI